jgi:hypothetical protein
MRYFFFPPFPLCVWERAEPAAVFDVLDVRLSRSVFDAAVAAFFPVVFLWATLHHLPLRPCLLKDWPGLSYRARRRERPAGCRSDCLKGYTKLRTPGPSAQSVATASDVPTPSKTAACANGGGPSDASWSGTTRSSRQIQTVRFFSADYPHELLSGWGEVELHPLEIRDRPDRRAAQARVARQRPQALRILAFAIAQSEPSASLGRHVRRDLGDARRPSHFG